MQLIRLRKGANNMNKTKIWLIVFMLLFSGAVIGSVLIVKVANNQTIDDFSLVAEEGYDTSVIEDISFKVEYELRESWYHPYWKKGDKCEFTYVNGVMKDLKFTEINEIDESKQPFALFESYELVGEGRSVGIRECDNLYLFSVADGISSHAHMRDIAAAISVNLHTEDGQYKYHHEKKFWSVGEDYYFFENGGLFAVNEEALCRLNLNQGWGTVHYPTIYEVQSEIDAIAGCEGGEYFYLTGIGNITGEGYTLYSYVVEPATGKTIDRQCYDIKTPIEVSDVNQFSFDYLVTDENYNIVTITQPMGEQDMYIISHEEGKCTIEYFDEEEFLAEDLYISELLEAKRSKDGALYLIYAESQIGKTEYDINWAKRNIMNLEDFEFNGIAFVAIENGEVVYKGYFSSETSKTMSFSVDEEVYVKNIEINLP